MSVIFNEKSQKVLEPEVEFHSAWHGNIPGLHAEDKLKGKKPFTYILRKGEVSLNYYVSFILPDLTIKHQPFVITLTSNGWYSRNGSGSGPFINQSIEEVIHLIMHCNTEDCIPLVY